jgi:hypothetical protein
MATRGQVFSVLGPLALLVLTQTALLNLFCVHVTGENFFFGLAECVVVDSPISFPEMLTSKLHSGAQALVVPTTQHANHHCAPAIKRSEVLKQAAVLFGGSIAAVSLASPSHAESQPTTGSVARLETLRDCSLAVSIYPTFAYNALGGGGRGRVVDVNGDVLTVRGYVNVSNGWLCVCVGAKTVVAALPALPNSALWRHSLRSVTRTRRYNDDLDGRALALRTPRISDISHPCSQVEFDAASLNIPPIDYRSTKVVGVPIPPPLKIEILPKELKGTINVKTVGIGL